MARKKVASLECDKTVGFGDKPGQLGKGQEVQGYYLGSKKVKTEYGDSKLHVLQTAEGNVGLWGSANLDRNLEQIPVGCMVFVKYLKKIKLPKGNPMKSFSVEFDDEDTIHVAPPMPASVSDEDEEDLDEQEENDSDFDSDDEEEFEEEEDETPPAPAKNTSAKGKSAAELLGKRRAG